MTTSGRARSKDRAQPSKTALALFLACLLPSGAAPVHAQQAAPLHACVIDEPPWGDAASPDRGIYPEILHMLSKSLGTPIDYTPTPLARTLFEVENGACDFTITSWDKGRSGHVTRGAVMAYLDYGVLPRRGLLLHGLDDLHRVIVAVPRGLLIGEPFDGEAKIDKLSVYGYEQAMTMVERGRADAALGSLVTLERIARLHGTTAQFGQPLTLAKVPLALQMNGSFAGTPRAADLERAITALRESGEADRVIAHHFADVAG